MKDSVKVNQTNILPLRWLANLCGEIAGWSVLKAAYLDEDNNHGLKYNIHGKIYRYTWPVYYRWGTVFKIDWDMSGKAWDDYDENGIPYWENFIEWDFVDAETDDAFRVIR
jgi:hypothetical protein